MVAEQVAREALSAYGQGNGSAKREGRMGGVSRLWCSGQRRRRDDVDMERAMKWAQGSESERPDRAVGREGREGMARWIPGALPQAGAILPFQGGRTGGGRG